MPRARNGRFTAERTTETTTTERVTERATVELTDTGDTLTELPDIHQATIHRAAGWDTAAITTGERQLHRAQRATQAERAEELIADWYASVQPPAGTPLPQWVKDATANMLRAGPHATPLQLKWGRDI